MWIGKSDHATSIAAACNGLPRPRTNDPIERIRQKGNMTYNQFIHSLICREYDGTKCALAFNLSIDTENVYLKLIFKVGSCLMRREIKILL